MTDERGTNLMRTDTVSSLYLIEDVYVPGRVFSNHPFTEMGSNVHLLLKGYFQKEFLCGLGRGVYIPPTILRVHQVIKRSGNWDVFKNISPTLAVVSPVHFLGYITYIQELTDILVRISMYGVLEVIAFTVTPFWCRARMMRAIFSCGVWNIYVEDTHTQHEWAPGTQVISMA